MPPLLHKGWIVHRCAALVFETLLFGSLEVEVELGDLAALVSIQLVECL